MRDALPLTLVLGVGGGILLWRLKARAKRIIASPRFGVLNLKGDSANPLIALDTQALAPILGQPELSSNNPPLCDVLSVYCDLEVDGRVKNTSAGLRALIRASGAAVVVIASENPGSAYVATASVKTHGRANLVMTTARKGEVFPRFFARLFASLKDGTPMPVAWVSLAPQIPGADHPDCPDTIFACEAGQVAFR